MRFTLPGSAGSSVVLAVLLAPPWSEAGRLVAFLLSVSVAGGRGVFARPLAVALGLDNLAAVVDAQIRGISPWTSPTCVGNDSKGHGVGTQMLRSCCMLLH